MERKTETPRIHNICLMLRSHIVVRIEKFECPPNMPFDERVVLCAILEVPERLQEEYEGVPKGYFYIDEMITIQDVMRSWSDFMTFAAFVKNYSPQEEPLNKGLVWRFWNIGHEAYMHLLKWDVKEQL